jgi:hypothetical protein
MATLSVDIVTKIKADLGTTLTQRAIAEKYGVSRSAISDIATERSHKAIPWPDKKPVPKRPGGQRKPIENYDATDKRIRELEAEVIHLTEERNRERAKNKASAKNEGLFHAIVGEMDTRIRPYHALPKQIKKGSKSCIVEHCVMHLSDGHHDQVVRPEEVGGLEDHTFLTSCCRAERYVDTVIDWKNTLAPQFYFPVLWILAYGDFSSGEIHRACERSYYRNQFKNCLAIGQLHALMYRDLASQFDQINVLYLPGNHGRRTPKKDYLGAQDNWDYLVAEVARLNCRALDNVSFLIPNAWSANLNINGVGFNVSHGDDAQSNGGVPWYGMVRRQKGLIALGAAANTLRCRYFCCGHHHVASSLSDVDGELVVNGSWIGTDSFVYNKLSAYQEPSQWLHGVNPKHGITWRMKVKLKSPNESDGPSRYIIDGGREVGPLYLGE